MTESPNWTTGANELAYKNYNEAEKVVLECLVHGVIGTMERKWIGKAEVEHRDIFGCKSDIKVESAK